MESFLGAIAFAGLIVAQLAAVIAVHRSRLDAVDTSSPTEMDHRVRHVLESGG